MLAEGLVREGEVVERARHRRVPAAKRRARELHALGGRVARVGVRAARMRRARRVLQCTDARVRVGQCRCGQIRGPSGTHAICQRAR